MSFQPIMIYIVDGVACCTASIEHDGGGNKWWRPSRDAPSQRRELCWVECYFTGSARPSAEPWGLVYSEPKLLRRNTPSLSDLSPKSDSSTHLMSQGYGWVWLYIGLNWHHFTTYSELVHATSERTWLLYVSDWVFFFSHVEHVWNLSIFNQSKFPTPFRGQ